ncbi:hypothetical protein, partial [uncultured Hoeflea sp.]|uniref:hypothetical protein n=1 Tax=uncultured Hoeflea sp. TaxID=538666 RepID=UPI0030DABA7F
CRPVTPEVAGSSPVTRAISPHGEMDTFFEKARFYRAFFVSGSDIPFEASHLLKENVPSAVA